MSEILESLLKDEVQQFIYEHENDDVHALVLRHKHIAGVPSALVAEQILSRKKARTKLPKWYQARKIIYPPAIALEQCSSESTARYKSSILRNLINKKGTIKGLDLTAGFGVDSHFFAEWADMTCVEPNSELIEIDLNNLNGLGGRKQSFISGEAETYLTHHNSTYDFIYIDPSRRSDGRKVFMLNDCLPDILQFLDKILQHTPLLLIKTSPLLDIQLACQQLQTVTHVWVVSVDNECKELLFLVERKAEGEPQRIAVGLLASGIPRTELSFRRSEEKAASVVFSDPLEFLYEPGAAVLKAGAFRLVAAKFGLFKLAPDSHLYTSSKKLEDFPGRIFRTKGHYKLDKKLKNIFDSGYANILLRNYPMTVKGVMAKTGLREGGQEYLICTRGVAANFVMKAEKIGR